MTNPADETMRIQIDDVVWREVGDDLVVLELSTSTYLTLNGTARFLWECLVDGATRGDLAERLSSRYGVDPDQALLDAGSFVDALVVRQLVAPGS